MSSNENGKRKQKILKVDIMGKRKDYDIIIGENLIESLPDFIDNVYDSKKIFLVSDENVMNLYEDKVSKILSDADFECTTYIVPAGEGSKSFEYLKKGYDLLLEEDFRRDNLIIALGGGVVGDLAGFIAATFMRGIPFIQIPTTLLAQVDSSVGGKTAVNHPAGKNLIGSFYQPELVIIDPRFLKTLPVRELKTGFAELIKHGFIADKDLMIYLYNKRKRLFELEMDSLVHVIYHSCLIKSEIVNQDEKEKGKRALLNFGHTIGHALEAVTAFSKYNHGEAVAVGMAAAAEISYQLGKINISDLNYLKEIIADFGLPLKFQYGEEKLEVFDRLFYDKKVKNKKIRWVLLKKLGEAYLCQEVSNNIINKVLEGLRC